MQKAQRFMCSTASRSSPSNTTIRSHRKSRMSSGGGDSLQASKTVGHGLATRPRRARSAKCSVRTLPGNLKNPKKAGKATKGQRPNLGSLQNAVVLAPFHTLKRCFQTKLVDLYSHEKMKKIQQKTKVAKKKNMSFEYDIIELHPVGPTVKKETKATKKSKRKSRSPSYCQCKKEVGKPVQNSPKVTKRRGGEAPSPGAPGSSGQPAVKRRRPNPAAPAPTTLDSALVTGLDLYAPGHRFPLSEANPTSSAVSSRSKSDFWESCADSPSCREERMRGSFAISTTSFDSYLETFDKGSCDHSESGRDCKRRTPIRRDLEQVDAGLIQKPSARYLIEQVEGKNSDEEISDFLDREPQTQEIPSLELDRRWQPLRRQSRTKAKKPENEEAAAASYYLRSLSSGKKDSEGASASHPASRQERRSCCPDASDRTKTSQIEVGTQMEGNGPVMPGPSFSSSNFARQESTLCVHRADAPLEEDSGEPPRDPRLNPPCHGAPSPAPEPPLQPEPPGADQAGLAALGERSDLASTEAAALPEALQGAADLYQAGEKESAYIFGARSSENRLGESCEFSFGLKWVFSDDED